MTLAPGARLGPYEILFPLGAGGMGEVWKARDTRVDRLVALKVLPGDFLEGEDGRARKDRFEREARLLASVSHPNVAVLYSFEEIPGSPPRHVLTMELLEGESLRGKLGAPLPPRRAIEIAVQIAHGLAAAHEKGIVHRDLKPENVFVTKDGRIKLLDFGIAKLTEPSISSISLTEAPTETPATGAGVVLGTVGYMSPEQVLGRSLDARSDLFSLGTVLYEMLAGRRPFQKGNAPETMAAIIREEPPDLADTSGNIPPGLDRIVRHCLEKEPESRFHSARDVVFALESLSQSTTAGTAPLRAAGRKRRLAIAALGIVFAVAAGAGLFILGKGSGRPTTPTFKRLTFQRGTITGARFAPDGRTVVYSAEWDGRPPEVFSERLDALDPVPSGYGGAHLLAVSGKSQLALSLETGTLHVWAPSGRLALAPFAGGTPRELDPEISFADFSPDGERLALVRADKGLEYPSGTALYTSPYFLSHVRISPSGEYVAFLDHTIRGSDSGFVVVVDRSGKTILRKGPFETLQGLAWSTRGDEVWFGGAASGLRLDIRAVTLQGRERIVLSAPTSMIPHDIGADGRVLASTDEPRLRIFYGRDTASSVREFSAFGYSLQTAISPDGEWVAFCDASITGADQSYLRSSSGAAPVSLGPGRPWNFSEDGRTLVVAHPEVPEIVLHPVGPGQPTTIRLDGSEVSLQSAGLFPDGKAVWFSGNQPSRPRRLWRVAVSGEKPRPLTPEGVGGFVAGDGKSVVFFRDGKWWIQLLAGGEARPVEGIQGGESVAAWTADGRPLFVFRRVGCPIKVYRLDPKTGRREFFREIGPADASGVLRVHTKMTRDGKAYVYEIHQILSELHLIEGLR